MPETSAGQARASAAQAELAAALARNGGGVPGFPAPHSEAEFAAMPRARARAWIDQAAGAMEAQAARREAARQDGGHAAAAFAPGDQVASIWWDGPGVVEGLDGEGYLGTPDIRVRTAAGATVSQQPGQIRRGAGPIVMAFASGRHVTVCTRADGDVSVLAAVKAGAVRLAPLIDPWLDKPVADAALAEAGWHRTEDWAEADKGTWCAVVTRDGTPARPADRQEPGE